MGLVNVSSIGAFIRDQREQARISIRQLAQAAGMSNPYLSQIERGLRKPSADILQQIAKGLRISAEVLYDQAEFLEDRTEGISVRGAVLADANLTERQKQMLIELYESFRKEAALAAGDAQPAGSREAAGSDGRADTVQAARDGGHAEAVQSAASRPPARNGRRATAAKPAAGQKPAGNGRRATAAKPAGDNKPAGTSGRGSAKPAGAEDAAPNGKPARRGGRADPAMPAGRAPAGGRAHVRNGRPDHMVPSPAASR